MLELLKAKWVFFGLDAPVFAWVAAAALLSFTFVRLARLSWLVIRVRARLKKLTARVSELTARHKPSAKEGLSQEGYDALVRLFEEGSHELEPAWQDFNAQVVSRPDPADPNNPSGDRYWASAGAGDSFSDEAVIKPRVNRDSYASVPSIVTGTGLLFTFLAILVALLDVRLVDNRVQGLELLIEGLSGKFVSSVAALTGATVFLLFEKRLFYRLDRGRHGLVGALDSLLPRITPARLLADLQRDVSEQTYAFRSFNTSLAPMLRQSFSESMGPTLERMVSAVEDLNTIMRAAEAQKQESITGSLDALLRNLEQSMSASIDRMGATFSESLSGSARGQFDKVAESLGGTAALLENMNSQFQATQAAMNELILYAKTSTAEQVSLGKSQVEELTTVLRALMREVNETAGSSVNNMASTLTGVVFDLSNKVTELGQQMTSAMLTSTEKTAGAANAIVERADAWTARSAEQLAALLEKHQGHLDRIEDVRGTLDATLARFNDALAGYAGMASDLRQISTQVSATVTAIESSAKTMTVAQQALHGVAGATKTQVDKLAEANRNQEQAWARIEESMRRYQETFGHVERTASELLAQIGEHLQSYVKTSENGFKNMVEIADGHFANATGKLKGSVEELDEALQDLSETLGKARNGGGGAYGRAR